jgi:hypothetical protein
VVNGVHYDESNASIVIDGVPGQTRAALKLGMIAQIDGVLDYKRNAGIANVIRVDHVLYGQIEAIDIGKAEVTILKQQVTISGVTRFDGAQKLAELQAGDWIAVHGMEDPGRKTVVATLVERVIPQVGTGSSIRGTVKKAQRGRLRIGKLDILVFNADAQDGDFVAVTGDYVGGTFVSTDVVVTREVETHESVETQLQGYVSDFRGVDEFTVAGVMIDASNAQFFGGRPGDLHQNVRITVEGPIRNGVLIAEEVEFSGSAVTTSSVELEGLITSFSSLADFTVKGRRIDASSAVIKSETVPKNGWKAHVKGQVAADGSLRAATAEFERP